MGAWRDARAEPEPFEPEVGALGRGLPHPGFPKGGKQFATYCPATLGLRYAGNDVRRDARMVIECLLDRPHSCDNALPRRAADLVRGGNALQHLLNNRRLHGRLAGHVMVESPDCDLEFFGDLAHAHLFESLA